MATVAEEAASVSVGEAELSFEEKLKLVLSIGENNKCIPEDDDFPDLRNRLAKTKDPVCYDGFEPSGRMHIAQGIMKVCVFKLWIADWFAQLNNKMDGDLKKIQTVGRYIIEVWKAASMNLERVEFLWSSEQINGNAATCWPLVMDIARRNTLKRITRCCTIMAGQKQRICLSDNFFYPCMQCAEIFFIEADICQLENCQLRVNMLALEYCDQIKQKLKPIILSHRILPTLFVTYFAFLNQLIQFAIIQFLMSSKLGDVVSKKLCSGYLRSLYA